MYMLSIFILVDIYISLSTTIYIDTKGNPQKAIALACIRVIIYQLMDKYICIDSNLHINKPSETPTYQIYKIYIVLYI